MSSLRPFARKSAALKVILASISDAYYEIDEEGRLEFFNHVLCEFLGRAEKDLRGTKLTDFMPRDAGAFFDKLLDQSDSSPAPVSFEWELVSDTSRRVLEASVNPIRDSRGRRTGFRGIIRDITARRQADDDKLEFHDRLLQSQKLESLGILAGGVAHKFNNMLMGILGFAELVRADLEDGSEAHSLMLELEDTAQRAAELTGQMLAYSGRGSLSVERTQLNGVIRGIEGLLKSVVGNGVSITLDLQEELPECEVDLLQIRQIIVNLVTNASEAMPQGGTIVITTGTQHLSEDDLEQLIGSPDLSAGQFVFVDVEDSGTGIEEENLPRIFDPFFTTAFTGRGLGLPAVLGIVRSHRGAIDVATEVGKGTNMRVFLPVLEEESRATNGEAQVETEAGGKVLVVDDEASVLTVTRIALRKAGFEVITADNGSDAIDVYDREWEDIRAVVLDLTMPEMSGEDVYRALVRVNPEVRVVVTSGYTEKEIDGRFEPENIVKFLQKPYRPDDLRAAVKQAAAYD